MSEEYTQHLPEGDPVPIRVTDFVTPNPDGDWWLARQSMACCAADAQPVRVRVENAPADWKNPPAEMWVDVPGTRMPEALDISGGTVPIPSVAVQDVVAIEPPANPYE